MDMASRLAWRKNPMTVEEWKAMCEKSGYVRRGDKVLFSTHGEVLHADVSGNGTSAFIGAFFLKGDGRDIQPSTGWCH